MTAHTGVSSDNLIQDPMLRDLQEGAVVGLLVAGNVVVGRVTEVNPRGFVELDADPWGLRADAKRDGLPVIPANQVPIHQSPVSARVRLNAIVGVTYYEDYAG